MNIAYKALRESAKMIEDNYNEELQLYDTLTHDLKFDKETFSQEAWNDFSLCGTNNEILMYIEQARYELTVHDEIKELLEIR